MTRRELRTVEHAAHRVRQADLELVRAMTAAREAGHTLRPIANAAGRSLEWTRQAIRRTAGGAQA